jgi:hypothetical protein
MSMSSGTKILAGVVALSLGSVAVANTSIDASATGDLFLNIVDMTNSTSFIYDTGISQAAFNGGGSYNLSLATDANLKSFLNGADTFDYSVISATKVGVSAATMDFTGGANTSFPTPVTPTAFNVLQAQASTNIFLTFANGVASATANSAILPTGTGAQGYWGAALNEGAVSNRLFQAGQLPYADNAALGTPLSFFQAVGSTLTTFAGTWNFSAATDLLSYSQSSSGGGTPPPPVPLPSPWLLLRSGLGLLGARGFARRARSAERV